MQDVAGFLLVTSYFRTTPNLGLSDLLLVYTVESVTFLATTGAHGGLPSVHITVAVEVHVLLDTYVPIGYGICSSFNANQIMGI